MMLTRDRNFAGKQIPGARPYQEDAQGFATLKEGDGGQVEVLLTVLADGMGGENAGDVASNSVVETFLDYCNDYHTKYGDQKTPEMLRSAMTAANEALATAIDKDQNLEGMGCTLLAAMVVDGVLYWISVGDSPLYLYREGKLSQINEDHSMMPLLRQLVDEGKIYTYELATHPHRNVLRSAMGGDEIELVDSPSAGVPLESGDIIIVASDGIQTLNENYILTSLDRYHDLTAEEITDKLLADIERAKRPRQDNASINVICIPKI